MVKHTQSSKLPIKISTLLTSFRSLCYKNATEYRKLFGSAGQKRAKVNKELTKVTPRI